MRQMRMFDHFFSGGCYIGEDGGFLRNRCPSDKPPLERYKCHNTEEYYYLYVQYDYSVIVQVHGQLCSNDSHYYQACDKRLDGFKATNSETLCKNRMCQWVNSPLIVTETDLEVYGWACDGEQTCEDNLDEANCTAKYNTTTLRSGP